MRKQPRKEENGWKRGGRLWTMAGMGDDATPNQPPESETPASCFYHLAQMYSITKLGTLPEVIRRDARQMEVDYLRRYRNSGVSLLYDARGRKRTLKQKFKWIAEQVESHRAEWMLKRPLELERYTRLLHDFVAKHPEYAEKARAVEALPLHPHNGPYVLSDENREALNQSFGAREVTVEDLGGVRYLEYVAATIKKRNEVKQPRKVKRRRFSNEERIAYYESCIAEIDKILKEKREQVETLLKTQPLKYRRWLKRNGFTVEEARRWHGLSREEFSGFQRRRRFYQKQIELGLAGVNLQDLWDSFIVPHASREVRQKSQYLANKKAAEEQTRREQRRKANLKRGQGAKAAEERRLQKALDIIHGGPPIRVKMKQAARFGIKLNEPDIQKQPYVTKMVLSVHKILAKALPKSSCNRVTADVLNSWFQFHDHFLDLTADHVRVRLWKAKHARRHPAQ